MRIAIDISPLKTGHYLQHIVRGSGFYVENLKRSLLKYYPENKYIFFTRGEKLPRDIELIHYPYFEPFFSTLPYFKTAKTVVTIHDLTPLVFPKIFLAGVKGKIKWNLQKLLLKKVDNIITDSMSSKKDIVKYAGVPEKKINVIYLAPAEEFKVIKINKDQLKKLKSKYHLPENFVLYVGDVTWNKNLPRLIESIKKNNLTLVLVGKALVEKNFDKNNSWNQDLVTSLKFMEGDKRFLRLGFVPTEDLVFLYNLATVFVMPSLYEGFGLPVLEAMACGCPVVTTREGSLGELAENAAFFVDGYDIDSIAEGINRVYGDEKIQKDLSAKGLICAKKFSWRKVVTETVEVYEKKNS